MLAAVFPVIVQMLKKGRCFADLEWGLTLFRIVIERKTLELSDKGFKKGEEGFKAYIVNVLFILVALDLRICDFIVSILNFTLEFGIYGTLRWKSF